MSAPSPLLSKALRMTCLRVVLGRYQRCSLTLFAFVQAYVAEVIRYTHVPGLATPSHRQRRQAKRAGKAGSQWPKLPDDLLCAFTVDEDGKRVCKFCRSVLFLYVYDLLLINL